MCVHCGQVQSIDMSGPDVCGSYGRWPDDIRGFDPIHVDELGCSDNASDLFNPRLSTGLQSHYSHPSQTEKPYGPLAR